MVEQVVRRGAQRKTIRKVIRKKMDEWFATIDDVELRSQVRENTIVTGGCIASMLMGERINDFDVYMRDKDTTFQLAKYMVEKFNKNRKGGIDPEVRSTPLYNIRGEEEERVVIYIKSAGVIGDQNKNSDGYEYFECTDNEHGDRSQAYLEGIISSDSAEDYITQVENIVDDGVDKAEKTKPSTDTEPYRVVFMSQNAITLSDNVQVIIRFYGEPDKIHSNYDFVHAMCYYDYGKDVLELKPEALESILSRTLKYHGSLYPIASLFRVRKFMERGWKISASEILKMAWQCSEIDMTDMTILREQLTGVDQAYFHQLIKIIEHYEEKERLEGKKLNIESTYVGKLIDEVFESM